MRRLFRKSVLLVPAVLLVISAASAACAGEKVTLQLKWKHQFQFAGYYAALHQGYYRDAGLDVSIVPATPGKDPVLPVLEGKAEYGVGTSSLLLLRNAGKPVVALAVIFQHSPYVLLTKNTSSSQNIHTLVGKRLMLEHQADELVAYLNNEGLPLAKLKLLEHTFNARDLIDCKVDVMPGYVTDDPDVFDRAGFAYHAYTPRSTGIDFYGDNLFTTENELKNHPARARAFREASLKGWHYALQHPEEMIDLITACYAPDADRDHLKYEAGEVRKLIQPELVEIGYMHAGRWRHIAETYNSLGMMKSTIDLQKFMYDPHPNRDLTLLYRFAAALFGIALLGSGVRLVVTSRRLKRSETEVREKLSEILKINASLEDQVEKRAKEIENSNVLLQMFMKYSPIYTFIQESSPTESRVLLSSENYVEMLGISGRDMVGKTMTELFPAELAAKITADNWEIVANGNVVKLEETFNGHVYYSIKFPIRQRDKTLLAGYTIDITEQKQLQNELQLKSSKLALATYLAKIVPWELDPVRFMFIFNDQFYELYDTTAGREGGYEMAVETYLREFSHPDDVALIQMNIGRVFAPGSNINFVEVDHRIISRTCRLHYVMTRVNIERDEQGTVVSVFGYNQDITERKRMEIELREAKTAAESANSSKSMFLSNMSHEIRTPLNAIIGYSTLIMNSGLASPVQDHARKIYNSGKLLLNVVNDILDFSKIESGQFSLEQVSFQPGALIDNVISLVLQAAREKGLRLLFNISTEIAPCLVGDPLRLSQILANLLSNGVKFTIQGEVELSAILLQEQDERQQVQFSIRDTGIGIVAEKFAKLFKPFSQADESTTRKFGGTGLGLSISKQLVEQMEGQIWCESAVGAGSTFSFTAWFGIGQESNLEEFTNDGASDAGFSISAYNFSGRRALLVDDIQTNRQLAVALLKDTGIVIDVCSNGAEAVAMILNSGKKYDLVLMDIQMPVMDGYEATRRIRGDSRFTELPIIAMTAYAMEEERFKVLRAGMNVHVAKPIDIKILLQVMNLYLNGQAPDDAPLFAVHLEEMPSRPSPPRNSEPHEQLPRHVAGLDVDAALLRLNGKVKMYNWLVRSFAEKWAAGASLIEDALNDGDSELASRHAHSIKGSAGTIGAVELAALAQTLETDIINGEPSDAVVGGSLRHFAAELGRLVVELARTDEPG